MLKGVSMNEFNSSMEVCSERCVGKCENESSAVSEKERSVEANASLSVHRAANTVSASFEMRVFEQVKQLEMFDLEGCTNQSEKRPKNEGAEYAQQRDVGIRAENKSIGYSTQGHLDCGRIVLRPSQLKRLINEAGLGNVLNERQVLRYRKETPQIESENGGIHLIRFVAALCRRRTKGALAAQRSTVSLPDLYALLEKQNYRCALTGDVLSPDDVAIDHIVPISSGGDFSIENSQLVSKAANRAKHTLSQAAFITLCKQVADNQSVTRANEH
jgi:5-methylcytosine-specific restriction endonuclease McrA